MKKLIISYTFSGNNALLAKKLAEKANADHTEISDLLPESDRGNQKALNAYRLSADEASYLSELVLQNVTVPTTN